MPAKAVVKTKPSHKGKKTPIDDDDRCPTTARLSAHLGKPLPTKRADAKLIAARGGYSINKSRIPKDFDESFRVGAAGAPTRSEILPK